MGKIMHLERTWLEPLWLGHTGHPANKQAFQEAQLMNSYCLSSHSFDRKACAMLQALQKALALVRKTWVTSLEQDVVLLAVGNFTERGYLALQYRLHRKRILIDCEEGIKKQLKLLSAPS